MDWRLRGRPLRVREKNSWIKHGSRSICGARQLLRRFVQTLETLRRTWTENVIRDRQSFS